MFEFDNIDLNGTSILEVGSRIVNYNLKADLDKRYKNFMFHGIDIIAGPGVDEVVDICNIDYKTRHYNAIFSITVLEHVFDWRKAINNIKSMLLIGGRVFLIVPSIWDKHNYPIDKWRYSEQNMRDIFADYEIEKIRTMVRIAGKQEGISFRAKKLIEEMVDLTKIEVKGI